MKRLFIMAVVATMFAACSKDNDNVTIKDGNIPDIIYISTEGSTTRVELNDEGNFVWSEGDQISLFYNNLANNQWNFIGKTGDTKGTFVRPNNYIEGQPTKAIYAVYPYAKENSLGENGDIYMEIESNHLYDATISGERCKMVAVGSDVNNLEFKNIFGWIKISLTGNCSVSHIILSGNNQEPMADQTVMVNPNTLKVSFLDKGYKADYILVGYKNDVTLKESTPTDFYVPVIPGTFENGISVAVFGENDSSWGLKTFAKSTTNEVTIERNHILPMQEFRVEYPSTENGFNGCNMIVYYSEGNKKLIPNKNPFGDDNPVIADVTAGTYGEDTYGNFEWAKRYMIAAKPITEIVATAFAGNEDIKELYGFHYKGVNIGASAFEESSLESVYLVYAGTIGEAAFGNCVKLDDVTLGGVDENYGIGVFNGCTALKKITIPANWDNIPDYMFAGCSALQEVTCLATAPPTIGTGAFNSISSEAVLYVPADAVSAYKESVWKNAFTIQALP